MAAITPDPGPMIGGDKRGALRGARSLDIAPTRSDDENVVKAQESVGLGSDVKIHQDSDGSVAVGDKSFVGSWGGATVPTDIHDRGGMAFGWSANAACGRMAVGVSAKAGDIGPVRPGPYSLAIGNRAITGVWNTTFLGRIASRYVLALGQLILAGETEGNLGVGNSTIMRGLSGSVVIGHNAGRGQSNNPTAGAFDAPFQNVQILGHGLAPRFSQLSSVRMQNAFMHSGHPLPLPYAGGGMSAIMVPIRWYHDTGGSFPSLPFPIAVWSKPDGMNFFCKNAYAIAGNAIPDAAATINIRKTSWPNVITRGVLSRPLQNKILPFGTTPTVDIYLRGFNAHIGSSMSAIIAGEAESFIMLRVNKQALLRPNPATVFAAAAGADTGAFGEQVLSGVWVQQPTGADDEYMQILPNAFFPAGSLVEMIGYNTYGLNSGTLVLSEILTSTASAGRVHEIVGLQDTLIDSDISVELTASANTNYVTAAEHGMLMLTGFWYPTEFPYLSGADVGFDSIDPEGSLSGFLQTS